MFRKYDNRPKHLDPTSVTFSMLTSDDVRKMSVTRIITSNVLDSLGHPLPGGLYDVALGEFCLFCFVAWIQLQCICFVVWKQ